MFTVTFKVIEKRLYVLKRIEFLSPVKVPVRAFRPVIVVADNLLSGRGLHHKAAKAVTERVLFARRNSVNPNLYNVTFTIDFKRPDRLGASPYGIVCHMLNGVNASNSFKFIRSEWASGNKYRLIVAIHYNRKKVYIRHVLTHAEYSRSHWRK